MTVLRQSRRRQENACTSHAGICTNRQSLRSLQGQFSDNWLKSHYPKAPTTAPRN